MPHLLIIDDDTRIRELLARFLRDSGFIITTAEDAFAARETLKTFRFDLIIVDVMMPGETGLEFTEGFRKASTTPVLMLTAMGEVEDRINGLQSGADDYLPKPFEPRELLLRIQRILQRTKTETKSAPLNFGSVTFNREKNALEQNGQPIPTTSGEVQLLTLLSDNLGKPLSRTELSERCGSINERSVDVQITRLRNKIESNPKQPRYLKTIRGKGYVLYSD